MPPIAVRVENLSKRYQLGNLGSDTLAKDLHRWFGQLFGKSRNQPNTGPLTEAETHWALQDVSFDVEAGHVVGIIGKNGAGKSTLLKILSRVTLPTFGRILARGRIASLLEVGTGFHPELTGRENIFLNGAILGMKKKEIQKKFDQIVEFSGVEKYIDTPVKRYSSGMYVRLAFAVAAHLESEILILDEVLAVGDAEFQKKCLGKMGDVARSEGRTVLFVSHNMSAVQSLCNQGVYLKGGRVVATGPIEEVAASYHKDSLQASQLPLAERLDRSGTGALRFSGFHLENGSHQVVDFLTCGEPARFVLYFENDRQEELVQLELIVGITNSSGHRVMNIASQTCGQTFGRVDRQANCAILTVPKLPLMPARYWFTLYSKVDGEVADWLEDAFEFTVIPGDFYGTGRQVAEGLGDFVMDCSFSVGNSEPMKTEGSYP